MKKLLVLLLALGAASLAAQDNLLKNPGFETPSPDKSDWAADWGVFAEGGKATAVKLTPETFKEGKQALKIGFDSDKDKFVGITQRVSVKPGQTIQFTVDIRNAGLVGASHVQTSLEWIDASTKKEIDPRSWGPSVKADALTAADWKPFELTAKAPENAGEVIAVVTVFPEGAESGAVLVDNAVVKVLP